MAATRKELLGKRLRAKSALTALPRGVLQPGALALAAPLILGAATLALLSVPPLPLRPGERIPYSIRAEVPFRVEDATRTAIQRQQAMEQSPSFYHVDLDGIQATVGKCRRLIDLCRASESIQALATEEKLDEIPREIAAKAMEFFRAWEPASSESLLKDLEGRLANEWIIADFALESRDPPSTASFIVIEAANKPKRIRADRESVVMVTEEDRIKETAQRLVEGWPEDAREFMTLVLSSLIRRGSTLVFDSARTRDEMTRAAKAQPPAFNSFATGEPIVLMEPHAYLTPEQYELLKAHAAAMQAFLASGTPESRIAVQEERLRRTGVVLLVEAVVIALLIYVTLHFPRLLRGLQEGMRFSLLILATLLLCLLFSRVWPEQKEFILIPCFLCAGTLAIVYPLRLALGVGCFMAVVAALLLGFELSFMLTLCTACNVTGFQLERVRSRTKIILTGIITGLLTGGAALGGALFEGQSLAFSAWHAGIASLAVLLAAFVFSGLLPFLEKIFQVATALTLLEWRDSTRPLLQLLASEAPGTYQHSLAVSTLTEAACKAVGADPLLTSLGAFYHDVGKIHKPEYFVENQHGKASRHEKLTPTMSLLIILAHVKDGVELARHYGLPKVLIPFIQEHHGTTLIRYFHHAAVERERAAGGKADREVAEADFRYPGPKPQTRESAILMICDGAEGAVRSLRDPTPVRIEAVVNKIIMDRLMDGQFDHCEVTMKDLSRIEGALVKSLCSLYHNRVSYPGQTLRIPAALEPAQPTPIQAVG